jgi:hypothetical protein
LRRLDEGLAVYSLHHGVTIRHGNILTVRVPVAGGANKRRFRLVLLRVLPGLRKLGGLCRFCEFLNWWRRSSLRFNIHIFQCGGVSEIYIFRLLLLKVVFVLVLALGLVLIHPPRWVGVTRRTKKAPEKFRIIDDDKENYAGDDAGGATTNSATITL